jgi:hypothetical protein
MHGAILENSAAVFTAIGTVAVAVLAIWGDWFRARLAGPRIRLALRDARGDLTVRANGKKTIYYHVIVTNQRTWSPAKAVRILVAGVSKRRPDGTYFPDPVIAPLQLTWAFPEFHDLFPTIATYDTCDFGCLDENSGRFTLSTYLTPNNFRGYVARGEAMRVDVIAAAHNVQSIKPLLLEVSWDGLWSADLDEMQRHLVIKEVTR